ncbi:MAG: methylmalonyl-CoA mutase family protein [FCB group bacterium]|nr:methylmalonyl-CoA mutase family protein [FCB group bacterium]
MFDKSFLDELKKRRENWEKDKDKYPQSSRPRYMTISGDDVDILYGPDSVNQDDYLDKIGFPGEFPYTRGVHHSMYRGRMWTMRQFSGMGTPKQTNERYHYLLKQGTNGLSVAFDLPTLMGYDSDHERSEGEIGKCGVAVDSLADMETIFEGIDPSQISTSMTINAPASILLAMYIAMAENKGVSSEKLTGTLQNDILKEYIAQKEWIYPPEPSIRLITDMMEFCTNHVPKWNTISISGYHIREAGATAAQELAFTLADGFQYVESAIAAGQDVDAFACRLSHFFNAHQDFFEEIAKYRAARRIWAKRMRYKYKAKKEKSWLLRFHTQTAGCSLTAQQPENNLMRTAFEALSGVLGGTQSLHTNSMDETLALPSDKAVTLALRTQQIIMHETGVTNTIDPLAGSYYIEHLTDKLETEAEAYFDEIERRGGVLQCIEEGYFQREIAKAAYRYQKDIEKKDRIIVGVNDYVMEEKIDIPLLRIDESAAADQLQSIKNVKEKRDNDKVARTLEELTACAKGNGNTMTAILECVRVYATEGEIVDAMRPIFGEYVEPPMF